MYLNSLDKKSLVEVHWKIIIVGIHFQYLTFNTDSVMTSSRIYIHLESIKCANSYHKYANSFFYKLMNCTVLSITITQFKYMYKKVF